MAGLTPTLTAVAAEGYRAFSQRVELPLPGLTVVFGANNSGKTAVARLPLFAMASVARRDALALQYRDLVFAADFRALTHVDDPHPRLTYALTWSVEGRARSVEIVLQLVTGDGVEDVVPIDVVVDGQKVHHIDIATDDVSAESIPPEVLVDIRQEAAGVIEGAMHIPSARPPVKPVYQLGPKPDGAALQVRDAPALLAHYPELLQAVSSWYREALGHEVDVDVAAFAFRLVTPSRGGSMVNMSAAGRGSQAALPVVTLLKAVELGIGSAAHIFVEEPEAHLHPSAHASLGDLLMSSQAAGPVVLAETHSEGLILRLRRRVAEGRLDPSTLELVYTEPGGLDGVRHVTVRRDGSVDGWPSGVFEYEIPEIDAIAASMFETD